MNTSLIQFREQFHLKHGGECVNIGGGMLLYADGAMMEQSTYGSTREPPEDPYQRNTLIVRYCAERLKRAVDVFEETRRNLKSLAQSAVRTGYPPPSPYELERLKEQQNVVRTWQRRLDAARRELKASTPDQQKGIAHQTNSNKANSELFLSELSSINI